ERNRHPPHAAPEAFARLENRLRSFILVHEALRRQNYSAVPVRDIVEPMAQRLRNTMDTGGRVRVEVTGDAPRLHERQGFALALIMNELITNAMRHGFPEGRDGTLRITIQEVGDEITIEVIDDGVGLPPPGTVTPKVGSGRSIVEAL